VLRHGGYVVFQLMDLPLRRVNAKIAVTNQVCKDRETAAADLFGARTARSRENF